MKCIRCNHDSKFKERPNKKCPNCGGTFVFEPQEKDRLTDMAFKNAIEAVSSHGSLRWGLDHLYYEVCRRCRSKIAPVWLIVVNSFVCAVCAGLALWVHRGWWFGTALFGFTTILAILTRLSPYRTVPVLRDTFQEMWERWCKVHGTPAGLIVRQPQARKPQRVEADLGDYSFDRAVICDRAETADLLLANNFHFENNCAVLTLDGYPPGPFETVRTMLRRNPRLEVIALHDATPQGCALAHQLATDPAWFANRAKVIDVGLRPVHAAPFIGLLLPAQRVVSASASISAKEAEWLAQYTLELAVIRPEQVLKRLFRALNNRPAPADTGGDGGFVYIGGGDGGSGGVILDEASFSTDASDTDGGGDSFG